MKRREMIKSMKTYVDEIKRYEAQASRRPTREARGRAEAYKNAGELAEALLDCWRWT